MPELVGYKLIDIKTGATVSEWGGDWGQSPGIPNPLVLPNGDQVSGAQPGETYSERYRLDAWVMDAPAPTKEKVDDERHHDPRRLVGAPSSRGARDRGKKTALDQSNALRYGYSDQGVNKGATRAKASPIKGEHMAPQGET